MNILVIGRKGMLGGAFLANPQKHEVSAISHDVLDISSPRDMQECIAAYRANVVINCAADTDVESAELRRDAVIAANALLPARLSEVCKATGAVMVQLSSTGCYGDWKASPYVEEDELRPTTVHHAAKARGEELVRNCGGAWLILRTGWLYGGSRANPKNFVWRRMEEAKYSATIFADAEQAGNPTFAGDVVNQTYQLLEAGQRGVFNCVAQGAASRLEYVSAIVEAAGLPCRVLAAPKGYFKRRARVSSNEKALNARLRDAGMDMMPHWQSSLSDYVRGLLR